MKLLEKGPATVTTRNLRSAFFDALAETAPDALRALGRLRKRIGPQETDSFNAKGLAFRLLVAGYGGDDDDFDAPEYVTKWASRFHMPWSWVLREAATWLLDATRGCELRFRNRLPRLRGGWYHYSMVPSRTPDATFVVHTMPEPFVMPGRAWKFWWQPWAQFRGQMLKDFQRSLDAYGKRITAHARRSGYVHVTEKHHGSSHHMRWFVQWQVLGLPAATIAATPDARGRFPDEANVRRGVRDVAKRLSVPLRRLGPGRDEG